MIPPIPDAYSATQSFTPRGPGSGKGMLFQQDMPNVYNKDTGMWMGMSRGSLYEISDENGNLPPNLSFSGPNGEGGPPLPPTMYTEDDTGTLNPEYQKWLDYIASHQNDSDPVGDFNKIKFPGQAPAPNLGQTGLPPIPNFGGVQSQFAGGINSTQTPAMPNFTQSTGTAPTNLLAKMFPKGWGEAGDNQPGLGDNYASLFGG